MKTPEEIASDIIDCFMVRWATLGKIKAINETKKLIAEAIHAAIKREARGK